MLTHARMRAHKHTQYGDQDDYITFFSSAIGEKTVS